MANSSLARRRLVEYRNDPSSLPAVFQYKRLPDAVAAFKEELQQVTCEFHFMGDGQMISRPAGDCYALRLVDLPADEADDVKRALGVVAKKCFPVKEVIVDPTSGIVVVEGDFSEIDAQHRP